MPDVVVLGAADGERGRAYAGSLATVGVRPRFVPYRVVLRGDRVDVPRGSLVRCETPSDDPTLDAELVRLGGGGDVDVAGGELVPTSAWYAGLAHLLARVDAALAGAAPHVRMQRSDTVLAMFDKAETARRLVAGGVPVPEHLGLSAEPGSGTTDPATPDRLVEALQATGWGQAFVKARHGSSGFGAVALRWSGERVVARSTVALVAGRAHNSPRLVTRHGWDEVGLLLDVLVPEGVVVQRWLPKWCVGGGPTDVRVVVIGGRARHVLVRIGTGPVTNLHLGARRGDVAAARDALGETAWARLLSVAEEAVACFGPCLYAGVDVLVTPSGAPYVLEVNAFGDFHEGVLVDGVDTYRAELAALAEVSRRGSAA